MTDTLPQRDDERFQQVLGRLDALVRRGQGDFEPPPPPAVSEATIPVLTEVYQPFQAESGAVAENQVLAAGPEGLREELTQECIERAVAEVLPVMVKILEDTLMQQVRPALDQALNLAVESLRPQIESSLRQHLQQALASSEQKD